MSCCDEMSGKAPIMLYLGGPIDLAANPHGWRGEWEKALRGITIFCPVCEFRVEEGPLVTIARNELAAATAKVAVFDLRSPTIGTPVEIARRLAATSTRGKQRAAHTVIVFDDTTGRELPLYLRAWRLIGATVVPGMPQALQRVRTFLRTSDTRPVRVAVEGDGG